VSTPHVAAADDLPRFHALFGPVLNELDDAADVLPARDVVQRVADRLSLTPEQRARTIPSGQGQLTNRVTWALRHRPVFFSEPLRVPAPLFKAFLIASRGLFRLPPAVVRAVSSPIFRPTVTPRLKKVFADPGVRKVAGDVRGLSLRVTSRGAASGTGGPTFDRVVAATGFRFSLAGLPFLSRPLAERLRGSGPVPRLGPDFQTAVPRLYLTGGIAEPTFGPAMRFIFGSGHAARRLGAELARL